MTAALAVVTATGVAQVTAFTALDAQLDRCTALAAPALAARPAHLAHAHPRRFFTPTEPSDVR
jgi:hypothetical protein